MRRLMNTLREILWTAVIAAALAVASVVCAVLGFDSIALAAGLAAITSALLAQRN